MWSTSARVALIVVDAFVALTAIGGGIALATGAEGNRFPVEWLRRTPFGSYLVPGLILAVAVGGSALLATAVTVWRPYPGGWLSVLAAVVLAGQIAGEIVLLAQPNRPTATELVYLAIALLMALLGVVTAVRLAS